MSKWTAGGANKITLWRIPFMLVVCFALVYGARNSLAWFWVAAVALIIGIALDKVDGWYAHYLQPGGPTKEGQYLDPFIDKWGFVYPIWLTLCFLVPMPWWFYVGTLLSLVLDIRSNIGHYRNYLLSLEVGFKKEFGSVWPGKIKFGLQNFIVCVLVAGFCPVDPKVDGGEWYLELSRWILLRHADLLPGIPWALGGLLLLASISLFRRKKISAKAAEEAKTLAQPC